MGVPTAPIAAYRTDDYAARVAKERGAAHGALGGYPG
jgi:L-rhamnose isomerase